MLLSDSLVIICQEGEISNTNLLNNTACDKVKTCIEVGVGIHCVISIISVLTLCSEQKVNNFGFAKT